MTVFTFKIFYDGDDNAQERYVAAECEAVAWKKLYDYLDQQCKAGFQFPRCICDPTVSAENVII